MNRLLLGAQLGAADQARLAQTTRNWRTALVVQQPAPAMRAFFETAGFVQSNGMLVLVKGHTR